jgi:hypothetical protein
LSLSQFDFTFNSCINPRKLLLVKAFVQDAVNSRL